MAVNDQFKRMRKEIVVEYFDTVPAFALKNWWKPWYTSK